MAAPLPSKSNGRIRPGVGVTMGGMAITVVPPEYEDLSLRERRRRWEEQNGIGVDAAVTAKATADAGAELAPRSRSGPADCAICGRAIDPARRKAVARTCHRESCIRAHRVPDRRRDARRRGDPAAGGRGPLAPPVTNGDHSDGKPSERADAVEQPTDAANGKSAGHEDDLSPGSDRLRAVDSHPEAPVVPPSTIGDPSTAGTASGRSITPSCWRAPAWSALMSLSRGRSLLSPAS